MILLDMEPIHKKLREMRRRMAQDMVSCKRTVRQYEGTEEGRVYAQQYKLSAEYLERYIDSLDKEFPDLKDSG